MKKTVLFLSLVLFSFFADANPLFFPTCKRIVLKDQYEYFFDAYGELLGCEEVGSSGMIYVYLGDEWREEGYFVEENGWCLYYCSWRNNAYVGKTKHTSEIIRDGRHLYEKGTKVYVDNKNRPVATYDQLSGQMGDNLGNLLGIFNHLTNPIGTLMNGGRISSYEIYLLRDRVRMYRD